ncbi:MAG: class I SAM-dependent methyltransferase [Bradymonadia bacterium]
MKANPPRPLPYPSTLNEVPLPLGPLKVWQPASSEDLLDALADAPPDPDDKMPYWADLWPSAIGLATLVEEGVVPVTGPTLELGAGLALVGLAAARASGEQASVTVSDWIDEAQQYALASAEENGLQMSGRLIDWRHPPDERWRTILAADVLYEPRNGPMLYGAIDAMLAEDGVAWIADPGRDHVPRFLEQLSGWQLDTLVKPLSGPLIPGGTARIRVCRLSRA